MGAWDNWVGRSEVRADMLTSQLLDRFHATLDSELSREIAPQGIHWCLCLPDAPTETLGEDGHPQRGADDTNFLPPISLPRRMWASSKVEFLTPITAEAEIVRTSTVASIREKTGGTGQLVFVGVDHETVADNVLAVKERQTIVYREAFVPHSHSGEGLGVGPVRKRSVSLTGLTPTAPLKGRGFDDWDFHRTITPIEALLFRYSALTFNSHRIHYDLPYAVEQEGYRGLVVHGPLTATLLLDLAARELGSNVLQSFAFRGQAPAFAGEALHLAGKVDGSEITLAALSHDGRVIMSAEAIKASQSEAGSR